MESLNSFKGYGKVDPAEDRAFQRSARRRIVLISVAVVLLLFLVVAVAVVVVQRHRSETSAGGGTSTSLSSTIKLVCSLTLHPDSCYASLSSSNSSDPLDLLRLSLRVAASTLSPLSSLTDQLGKSVSDSRLREALAVCGENIQDSLDLLNTTVSLLTTGSRGEKVLTQPKVADMRTYLSAVLTDLDTCLDGFEGTNGTLRSTMAVALRNSTELASNSLAILTHLFSLLKDLGIPVHRKLLATSHWAERRINRVLLQQEDIAANVTVAQDGSGDVTTISDALAMVPKKSTGSFVIRVKAGKYDELVRVEKYMWNVVLIGDGPGKSIITGSRNFAAGTPTFNTASFVVEGNGLTARGMTFENTAGAEGSQAVAARVKADQVVFYQCSFEAFQDTLYAHSHRQFYRDCDVVGTVDFIFGNAAAVFQNCRLMPRQPGPGQLNMITAHGRSDPNENTGFAVQSSTVVPYDSVTAPSFLGRPWKVYATVVYLTTEIAGVVDPKGWRSWDGTSELPATTYYGEYMNTGSGAATAGRVKWAGYTEAMTVADAQRFSVATLIQGGQWLPTSGVAFKLAV